MVQQARTYLAGAVSATVVVAIAVVAFVVLVSLQALQDWPLAKLGGADEESATISNARPASGGSGAATEGGGTASSATPAAPDGVDAGRVQPNPTGTVDATAPSVTEGPGEGSGPTVGNDPSGPTSSSAAQGAGAVPKADQPSSPQPVQKAVQDTVSGVERTVEETAAGATQAVQGIAAEATGPSSPVGQLSGQTTKVVDEVTGGLLGDGR